MTIELAQQAPPVSPLMGMKLLSIGGVGTGKTTLIKSLVDSGVTPMCLFTEPSYDVLGDVPKEKLHWTYVKTVSSSLANLLKAAKRVGTMTPELIQKTHDTDRDKTNQFYAILNALANFQCERTGENFGNVSSWGTDKILVVDSLSGITKAAEKLGVGEKYAMTQPEFQIVMKTIDNLVIQLCTGFHCHVYLTAHAEREMDEVFGGVKIYPSTLGKKLAPTLGRWFTDVFMTKRTPEGKFIIDFADPQADLKARNAEMKQYPPDLKILLENWKKRGGLISPTVPESMQ